ncbi:MAG TPA: hypothetical protein VGM50_09765, partial [Gemmatimonadaceae bacterium]
TDTHRMSLSPNVPTQVQRVTFTPEGEYALCVLDFSNVRDTAEALSVIREARESVSKSEPFSLRMLTDIMGSQMSLPVISALVELARANEPFVTRSAVIGLALPHRVALRQIRRLTGRDIREFGSRDEALAYLRA